AVLPIFRRMSGFGAPAGSHGTPGDERFISSAAVNSSPNKRAHWVAFNGALTVLLIIFAITLSILEWRKQDADTRKELQSVAEIGARAVGSYFDVLERSLKGLASTLPDVRQDDINSPEFTSRARGLLADFYAAHPELAVVMLIRPDGHVIA